MPCTHSLDASAVQDQAHCSTDDTDLDAAIAARIESAILRLRHGREVSITDQGRRLTVIAVEHLAQRTLATVPGGIRVLISRERARIIGHTLDTDTADVQFPARTSLEQLRRFAGIIDPTQPIAGPHNCAANPSRLSAAALELARQAARMPALLVTEDAHATAGPDTISADDIATYRRVRGTLLEQAARAEVQLARAPRTEFVVFRERFGDAQHVAVIVGEPKLNEPVKVRLHSACFTGDIFGSMRCDCGEQLTGAIDRMAASEGGVILYLDQEGRGIGLANKLRAYQLQAAGYDTIEADAHLGFGPDGRDFTAARTMLQGLGIREVRLLTNNPAKVTALSGHGIEVRERLPLAGSINAHNERYLVTKLERAGHLPSVVEGRRCDH